MIWLARATFLLMVAGFGAFGLSRLDYNVDILSLLPPDLPGLEGTRQLRDGQAASLIAAVEADSPETSEAAADSLAAYLGGRSDLVDDVRGAAGEAQAGRLADAVAWSWWNAGAAKVDDLRASLEPDAVAASLESAMDDLALSLDGQSVGLAAYDPLSLSREALAMLPQPGGGGPAIESDAVSRDGRMRLISLEPRDALSLDYRAAIRWVDDVRDGVESGWRGAHPEFAGVSVGFTGELAFRAEVSRAMESDMRQSIGAVSVLVAALFWLLHRSLKPMFWLLLAILCTNLLALGAGVAIYGPLNVMSIGFAAILTGLIEDFGVVGLHESIESPGAPYPEVLRNVLPGVAWSAGTVAAIFATLSLSRLPGVAQLGVLCALGVLIGAAVMLFGFLPVAMRSPLRAPAGKIREVGRNIRRWTGPVTAAVAVACLAAVAIAGLPDVLPGSQALRPRTSEAYDTFDRIARMTGIPADKGTLVPVVVRAESDEALRRAVAAADRALQSGVDTGELVGFFLPGALIPDEAAQRAGVPGIAAIADSLPRLRAAISDAGFTDEAAALTDLVFARWGAWAAADLPVPPPESLVAGVSGRLMRRDGDLRTATGYAVAAPGRVPAETAALRGLDSLPGVRAGGWEYMQPAVESLLRGEILRVGVPAAAVVLVLLPLVFRGWREIAFAAGTLAFGAFALTGVMAAAGLTWNVVSVAAIPIVLGLGLDFTIHMMHALRRHPESVDAVAGMGRALAYCGLSTGLAFGALGTGTNRGLVSLGLVAMSGVLIVLFTAAFVLPWAWHRFPARSRGAGEGVKGEG